MNSELIIRQLKAELFICEAQIKELEKKNKELEEENKELWTENRNCAIVVCKVLADEIFK